MRHPTTACSSRFFQGTAGACSGFAAALMAFALVAISALAFLGVAYAEDGASGAASPSSERASSTDNAGSDRSARTDDELPIGERAQGSIASCIAGLFAGWGVTDPPSFYAGDALLLDDGSCVWLAFDVYRAGATDGSEAFLKRMEDFVSASYAGDEHCLDPYSPTTWSRTALVVGTMGANPKAFGTNAEGAPADLLSDGLYNWAYTDDLADQGSNALIYALQAIDALQVAVPSDAAYSAEDVLEGLLACQASDGSFALSAGSATGSVDLTGMAIAALAPYRDAPEVAEAVDAALAYLADEQDSDGGFSAEGESTSESCAMVIVGLSACGIDVVTDERFAKKGKTPLDALLSFQKGDGTFAHTRDDVNDASVRDLPTEQALRALLAYEELRQGGDGNVYTHDQMLDVWKVRESGTQEPGGSGEADFGLDTGWVPYLASIGIGAAGALVVVALIWAVRKMRRKVRR